MYKYTTRTEWGVGAGNALRTGKGCFPRQEIALQDDRPHIAPSFALLVKQVAKSLPVYQELQMYDGRPFTMGVRVAGSLEDATGGAVDVPGGVILPSGTNAEFIAWLQWRTTC
jgi:hypothetical protein